MQCASFPWHSSVILCWLKPLPALPPSDSVDTFGGSSQHESLPSLSHGASASELSENIGVDLELRRMEEDLANLKHDFRAGRLQAFGAATGPLGSGCGRR